MWLQCLPPGWVVPPSANTGLYFKFMVYLFCQQRMGRLWQQQKSKEIDTVDL